MVAERPQLSDVDSPEPGRAGETVGPEPADGWAWSIDRTLRPTWQDYYQRGAAAFALAQEIEMVDGVGESGEPSNAAVAAYREASENLLAVTTVGPINHRLREAEPPSVARLLMLGTSFAKQAEAAVVEPYGKDPLTAHIDAPADRRANLRRLSKEAMERASEMVFGQEGNQELNHEFDQAQKAADMKEAVRLRREILASSAVEAAAETGTAEYAIVTEEDMAERLQREGQPAMNDYIEKNASHPKGTKFLGEWGKIAVARMAA